MRNDGHPSGSWYAETAAIRLPGLPAPEGAVHTGVCVVGAGFTGLGAALALAERPDAIFLGGDLLPHGLARDRRDGRTGRMASLIWRD